MKKYKIAWSELHEVEVEAQSEAAAIDMAYCEDYELTKQNTSLIEAQCLGGICDEHNLYFSELEEYCPKCQEDPEAEREAS